MLHTWGPGTKTVLRAPGAVFGTGCRFSERRKAWLIAKGIEFEFENVEGQSMTFGEYSRSRRCFARPVFVPQTSGNEGQVFPERAVGGRGRPSNNCDRSRWRLFSRSFNNRVRLWCYPSIAPR